MNIENILLKDILNNNTLYEVEDVDGKLEYLLDHSGDRVRICEIDDVDLDGKFLCGDDGVAILSPHKKISKEIIYQNLEVSFVPLSAIDEKKGIIKDNLLKQYSEVSKGYTFFQENDILFAKVTPSMENGNCVIATNLKNSIGFASTELNTIRCKENIYTKYIWLILRSEDFRNKAKKTMKGTGGLLRVPSEFFSEITIKIPKEKQYNDKIYSSYMLQQSIAKNIEERLAKIDEKYKILESIDKLNLLEIEVLLKKFFTNELDDTILVNNNLINLKNIEFEKVTIKSSLILNSGSSEYAKNYYENNLNAGDIPLYTGSRNVVANVTAIKESDIIKIESCSFNKDNDAGTKAFYHSKENPYIVGGHHYSVIINNEFKRKLKSKYLYYYLDLFFKKNMFYQSHQPVATKTNINKFHILIPIKTEYYSELEIQDEIIKYFDNKIIKISNKIINTNKIKETLTYCKEKILNTIINKGI